MLVTAYGTSGYDVRGWFEPATSRVSDDGTLARSAHMRSAAVGPNSFRPKPTFPLATAPMFDLEVPANEHLLEGRGWFRTSVLSRVKHGVRGPSGR